MEYELILDCDSNIYRKLKFKTKEDCYSYLRAYKKKYDIQAKYIHYTITKDKKFFDFNSVKVIKIVEDEKGVENNEINYHFNKCENWELAE